MRGAWRFLAIASCSTADTPAVIVHPNAASRASVSQAISDALGGAPVTIADDAFTQASEITIERAPVRDPGGHLAQGRETGMPERFRLVRSSEQCFLVHERTGKRYELAASLCAARSG